jgi:hypothetical protein
LSIFREAVLFAETHIRGAMNYGPTAGEVACWSRVLIGQAPFVSTSDVQIENTHGALSPMVHLSLGTQTMPPGGYHLAADHLVVRRFFVVGMRHRKRTALRLERVPPERAF